MKCHCDEIEELREHNRVLEEANDGLGQALTDANEVIADLAQGHNHISAKYWTKLVAERRRAARAEAAYQSLLDEQESKRDVIRHSHE